MTVQQKEFSATVRQPDGTAIIDLHGEINTFAEAALNAAYEQAVVSDPASIILNFSDVSYINSTGIALIVALLAQTRKTHRRLVTCGLSEHYQEIFRITRLSDFMTIHADEASALAEAMG
ncbi:MAG: STAS domain-containing protein [Candidatus Promineifilaceae bacterium]